MVVCLGKYRTAILIAMVLGGLLGAEKSVAAQGVSPVMDDFALNFMLADMAQENDTCVILSNGGDTQRRSYRVTVTEDGVGDFEVSNGIDSLPVHLYWRDDENSAVLLNDGVRESTWYQGNTTSGCGSSPVLSYLEVEFLLSDYLLTYAPSGNYSANLDIFYERIFGGGDFTDNVTLDLDIAKIVQLSGLQDVSLDFTNWSDGSNIQNVQSFCIYTNDSANEVSLTPSSTTLHNGNANMFGLQGPTNTRRYNVRLRETGGSWGTFGNIDNGDTVGPFDTAGRNFNCSNGGENAQVRVRFGAGQLGKGSEGIYTGVLLITITVP